MQRHSWIPTFVAALAFGLAGCPTGPDDDDTAADDDTVADDDTGDDDAGDDDTVGDDDSEADDDGYPLVEAHTLDAQVTWTVDFDADAEAEGYVDCEYSRTYAGVQFLDQPYLCPDCTLQFAGEADMFEGYEECYVGSFGGDPQRTEYWGFAWPDQDGGEAVLFRGARENLSVGELATVPSASLDEPFEIGWTGEYTLEDLGHDAAGSLALAALGTATVSLDAGIELEDLRAARSEPYACGWPLGNPGTLADVLPLADDATFPRAWLEDACGDLVDLWDLHGSYLVVDSTQHDCGYCLQMALAAPDFLAEMEDAGIPVRFVSLLGEGLSNVVGEPTQEGFEDYEAEYGVPGEPLLKDRGFGYAVFQPYWEDDIGWPVWAIVRPDMTLLTSGKGFTGWEEMGDAILADAGR